jgi:hypothetical protein
MHTGMVELFLWIGSKIYRLDKWIFEVFRSAFVEGIAVSRSYILDLGPIVPLSTKPAPMSGWATEGHIDKIKGARGTSVQFVEAVWSV